MPESKKDMVLRNIAELEESIRVGHGKPVEPRMYLGPLNRILSQDEAVEYALWFLERGRKIAKGSGFEGVGWCIGVAAGLVLPFGIAAAFRLPLVGSIYPAINAPTPY